MTQMFRFSRFALLLLAVVLLAGTGCSRIKGMFKDKDANEGVPVEQLYTKGHKSLRGGNYDSAITTYQRLVAQYPEAAKYTSGAIL